MPHELLADVVRSGDADGRARRRWSVLPLSVAAHLSAAAAILIVPLAADVEMPVPAHPARRILHVVAEAPRPPDLPVRGAPQRVPSRRAAPSEAPTAIVEETPISPDIPAGPPGPPVLGPVGAPDGWDPEAIGVSGVTVASPPSPDPPKPVRPGGKIREPQKIFDVVPVYPPVAIAVRKEGVVILEALLDVKGNVQHVKVLRSEPLLDHAAVEAVRRWRYTPTLLNGVPVPVLMTVTVRFSLR